MSLDIVLVALLLGGWFFGKAFEKLGLPSVLGMTIYGVLGSVFFKGAIPQELWGMAPFLQTLALVIILLRAGLGISRGALVQVGVTSLLLGVIPCLIEGFSYLFMFKYLMDFSWSEAGAIGFILSAVSPAVVIPSMLELKQKNYGKKREIPTLVLASAALDDVVALMFFSIFATAYKNADTNLLGSLIQIPISLAGGIFFGLVAAYALIKFYKRTDKKIRATEKLLLLVGISLLLMKIGKITDTATLLGVMAVGFLILEKLKDTASELSTKLNKFWLIAQLWLFTIIGLSVDVMRISEAGFKALLIIVIALVMRSIGVYISTIKSGLKVKERFFIMVSLLPKATVQAVMGSVPLAMGMPHGNVMLAIAVMSIVFTAPLGLIGIKYFGPRLLERED